MHALLTFYCMQMSRESTPYDPGSGASVAPLAVSQLRGMSQKALEASEKDLNTAEMESKELHQIANLVSRVKKRRMDVQRVEVSSSMPTLDDGFSLTTRLLGRK